MPNPLTFYIPVKAVRPLLLSSLVLSAATAFAQTLPSDAQQTCTANIAPWFQSGSVTPNGFVNPANSLNLDTSNNCNFYLWSEQMFLWMTSPSTSIYGGKGRVFQSPVFYGVTSCGDSGGLCFVPQFVIPTVTAANAKAAPAAPKLPPLKNAKMLNNFRAALRPAKRGPHGLPVVIDRSGRAIEITDAQFSPRGKPVVVGANGKVEISKIIHDAETKKVRFIDAVGDVITNPKPVLSAALKKARAGQRFFTADGTPIVIDPTGVVLDVSPEQAGKLGAVLLSQSNSIVYYSVAVNDVYAWFLTGVANGAINTNNQFPTTQSDLNQITAYAAKYGVTLTDADALALEVKLSWVDASTLSNPSDYITTQAEVPNYNTSSSTTWTLSRPKTRLATLALLGVHVVGSAKGHPEMIWSTFEHFNNAPNGTYQYVNVGGNTVTVNQNTNGSWLLTANGSSGPFNIAHANYLNAPSITAQAGQTISGSDTLREYAFGVAPTGVPNQNDATPAIANTEVISINNSVLGQLASGDVRANYYFVGSTWTFGGYAPTQPYPVVIQSPNPDINGSEIGTSYLTNSTMETYEQAANMSASTNCFSCHGGGGGTTKPSTPVTTGVSHIYGSLMPLFNSSTSTPAAKPGAEKKSTK